MTFYNGSNSLGTGSVSGGVATFTTSSLAVGTDSIKAIYGGDTNFKTSTSAVLAQTVQPMTNDVVVQSVDCALGALSDDDTMTDDLALQELASEQVSAQGVWPLHGSRQRRG